MSSDDKVKHGWVSGTMQCWKCGKVFRNVRFRYSCYDKVEGHWPECCDGLALLCNDWKPEGE